MRRPKAVAAVLAGATLVLGAGSAVAATLPSWTTRPAHSAARAPAVAGTPVTSPSASVPPARAPSHAAVSRPVRPPARTAKTGGAAGHGIAASVTYTVRPGDTLSGIAHWFKLHGYGALYAANAAVIGSDPNLIIPGERITITDGVMKLSGPR